MTPRAPARPSAVASSDDVVTRLRRVVSQSRFAARGAIVTDLDGTAVHEQEGRIVIADAVEVGLKALKELGRPVVLNSLRFPLSVMRTFGREWFRLTGAPVPLVSCNGSQIGHIVADRSGRLAFDELDAFPLSAADIDEVLAGVRGLRRNGVDELLLFYYPRDWSKGEIVWTPIAARTDAVIEKYPSASKVIAVDPDVLAERLHAEEICMIFLQVDVPEDLQMAYQHTKRTSFFTRRLVDKLYGARAIARHLGVDLEASAGAGDTELDTFLDGVGLSIHVGNQELAFKGLLETIKIADSLELGALLLALADATAARRRATR